ncbi:hypothetical protein BCR44DRAFT_65117 [Catenaria anguillulae PL171]|uniref:Uncharacterized protein n=1 Tax=Catenaria anguillulae PL171 TaxID=765915 RepID=A0A1Y2HT93_9FUNG|nr:hypothetical protein BCR44DRAFT_65117 [Catenaria anguillulae PL171]
MSSTAAAPVARPPVGPKPAASPRATKAATSPVPLNAATEPPNAIREVLAGFKKPPPQTKPLFEAQCTAPAPSQTYFQVVVQDGQVILRDWPKLRFSQAIAKQTVTPSAVSVKWEEYKEDNLRDKIREVFGEDVDNSIVNLVSEQLRVKATADRRRMSAST